MNFGMFLAGMTVQGKGHLRSYRQQIVDVFEIRTYKDEKPV